MRIDIDTFKGMYPRIEPHLLPNNAAQDAVNCRFLSGGLRPWKDSSVVNTPTKVGTKKSIYLFGGQYWFHWTTDVDVVKGAIAGDTLERTYFTGDGVPKYTTNAIATSGGSTDYPMDSYTLGMPTPGSTITATPAAVPAYSALSTYAVGDLVQNGGSYYSNFIAVLTPEAFDPAKWKLLSTADLESRAYVHTYVSGLGEEGPPSAASAIVNVYPNQRVDLTNISGVPAGDYNVTKVRIYRTNTGSTGTIYQFVAEINVGTTTYNDTKKNDELGEELPSTDWSNPPSDLKGLITLPNGSLAGFSGNQLCFSVPYQPHAWPVGYRYTVDYPIVAIGAFGNSVLVTTSKLPFISTGTQPDAMIPEKMEAGYANLSKRGTVDLGYAAAYPSAVGIVVVGTGRMEVATEDLFSKDEWAAFNPSSINAYQYVGQYVGFYDTGTTQGGFIFNPTTKDFTKLNFYATAGFYNDGTGELYLMVGNNIAKFEGDGALTYTWKSKKFLLPSPVNFGAAKVDAGAYPVTFKLYADGVLKHTQTVLNGEPFRLPGGYLADEAEIELSGTSTIKSVSIAESIDELQVGA